jgi:hypothetical protein
MCASVHTLIDQPAKEQEADAVGGLEPEHDVSVADLGPAVLLLQRRLEHAEHEAIDVAQHDCQEQQSTDDPPDVTGSLRHGRVVA